MTIYPLDGYRIIDFGWVYAAPLTGKLLADMGAEVIKVESHKRLDEMRQSPSNLARDPEKDPIFHDLNRNKLGITVDIAHPTGRALIKKLVKISDAIIENFSPHVLMQYGLDYESLKKIKDNIVMVSLSAAGQYGPLRDIRTYGPSLSSLAGLDGLVGYPGERVMGSQGFYADMVSAIHGAFALLVALYHRSRTGEGQYIDMAQWEATICCIGEAVMEYVMNARSPGTLGNRHPTMAPHNKYRCKGEDKWVSIAVKSEDEWNSFSEAIGQPYWAKDGMFADRFCRLLNQDILDKLITMWTIVYSPHEVADILRKVGIAAAPCLHIGERYFDAHFQERQVYLDVDHPATGTDILSGIAWKFSEIAPEIRRPAPLLGQHNKYVFCELLGIPEDELAQLVEKKITY